MPGKMLFISFLVLAVVLLLTYAGMASAQNALRDDLVSYWTFDQADKGGRTDRLGATMGATIQS